MAIPQDKLHELIKNSFADAEIELTDLAGDNDHYQVRITSSAFSGKTKVAQHRMVNDALRGCLGDELHALSIKTIVK
jgi:stress-induced morphogen